MKHWFAAGFLAVLALAAALRLPDLSLRPMHNDEAVNAIKFRALWTANNYKYDPNEFHGPTLPYFTLPAAWSNSSRDFNDFSEITFRLVTVGFGIALVAVLLLLTRDFGRAETWWASLFVALSPAMVFYSRYYIHEMLLVFFTALTAAALWRFAKEGGFGWLALAGAGLGLMSASKETFVFAVISIALATACAAGWTRFRGESITDLRGPWNVKFALGALSIAVVVALLFFSSFFSNAAGVVDAVKTYAPWLHRAEGASPHAHSWTFYFQRLLFYHANGGPIWSEGLIAVLAVIGFVAALAGREPNGSRVRSPHPIGFVATLLGRGLGTSNVFLLRIIAFYTAWLTLIYTVLPYKTPWCLLGFYHGALLLAGVGAAVLLRCGKSPPTKSCIAIALLGATGQLGWQAWRLNFATDNGSVPYCDSIKNPYAYSQTTPDIYRLMTTVVGLEQVSPDGYATVVEVMSPDSYWPLPWYLRRFTQVGFWSNIPNQPLAPIMIVSTALQAGFDERPEKTHLMAGYFQLRPGVFFELYVRVDLWAKFIKTVPPEKD